MHSFVNWLSLREAIEPTVLRLITVKGSSSGSHGFGGSREEPAGDPAKFARWDVPMLKWKTQVEPLLSGSKALIVDSSGGSFHERWCKVSVFLWVPYNSWYQIEDLLGDEVRELDTGLHANQLGFASEGAYTVVFESFSQIASEVWAKCGVRPPDELGLAVEQPKSFAPNVKVQRDKPVEGEDRDAYWARMMNKHLAPSKAEIRYGPPGKNRPWDGD
jgi:hypothetical protein